MEQKNLLSVENLTVALKSTQTNIVEDVSFSVAPGAIVGLVGASGSGKSSIAFSIMRLLMPALEVTGGKVLFRNENLFELMDKEMRALRGSGIGFVFQEPLDAFNPVFTIGDQITEVLLAHTNLKRRGCKERVRHLLDSVGIKSPDRVAHSYPHQLSGGMRQRAMIAQAIAAKPKLIIADEPTSNLDVTLQARIMELFCRLRDQQGLTILLISHDLGMVQHMTDEVVVLSLGRVVEQGLTKNVVAAPCDPYTKRLIEASLM